MSQHMWSMKDTFELIKRYKASMLWDSNHLHYRDKTLRSKMINNIASAMNVSPKEVVRKLHNLRCQLSEQIRKSKSYVGFKGKIHTSNWCYFSAMKFLLPAINNAHRIKKLMEEADSEEKNTEEHGNLEEVEEKYETIPAKFLSDTYNEELKHSLMFLPKIPEEERNAMEFDGLKETYEKKSHDKYVNFGYNEELTHSLRIVPKNDDDRFGEYVALELRGLRSDMNKRRLKSEIRKAICRIVDFDEANILASNVQSEHLFPNVQSEPLFPNVQSEPLFQYTPSSPKCSQICEITNVKSENA
ncbi:uncharacterized protein LOC116845338 [Odontomachus brunneus]|uniref:uncharacterized protein LOC116845338 n=1 Tax=Odontomachus brunneus TaxID=486640 RepID=UPI0013F1FB19|nr:uncharacterized protein LOC116845338 [Odontomachus brunneus]